MLSTDREEFVRLLRVLCNARSVPCTEDREECFWKGLTHMSLIQFGRAVDLMCAEEDPPKGLQPSHVWKAHKSGRVLTLTAPLSPVTDTHAYTAAQVYANTLLLDWLNWHIRGHGEPIAEDLARRMYGAARELADQMQMLFEEEDPEATSDRFHVEFCRNVVSLVNESIAQRYGAHLVEVVALRRDALRLSVRRRVAA